MQKRQPPATPQFPGAHSSGDLADLVRPSSRPTRRCSLAFVAFLCALCIGLPRQTWGEGGLRFRGPDGNAISRETNLPLRWSQHQNIRWKVKIPGEGSSSPIVQGDFVFLTSAEELGQRRLLHCLDRRTGRNLWTRSLEDADPEIASSLTGHAASTPCCDGQRVVCWFGRAGLAAWDYEGKLLWRVDVGKLESELGFASSPILYDGFVLLVCDHDGDKTTSQDSYLLAVEAATGQVRYKTPRPGLYRSWATPLVVPSGDRAELIVAAQDHVRGYEVRSGKELWRVSGTTGWVAPSPVAADGLVFVASGRSGPILALRPGGSGDVASSHVTWRHETGGPYVCSPLCYQGHLYIHDETGVLSCFQADSGRLRYRQRLKGKFTASGVAGDGRVFLINERGTTFVIQSGAVFKLLSENHLGTGDVPDGAAGGREALCLASPAIAQQALFIRLGQHLYCIGEAAEE